MNPSFRDPATPVHVIYDQAVLWAVVNATAIAALVAAAAPITVGRRPDGGGSGPVRPDSAGIQQQDT